MEMSYYSHNTAKVSRIKRNPNNKPKSQKHIKKAIKAIKAKPLNNTQKLMKLINDTLNSITINHSLAVLAATLFVVVIGYAQSL